MASNLKPVPEVDFEKIRNSLKLWLSQHSDFTDHNFEGSVLSTVLDVLAYNTHFNAMYDNMAINESFLDSSIRRGSVVSRAKEAGYLPYSTTASQAIVNVVITDVPAEEQTATRTILRGTKFIGKTINANVNKVFVVTESKTVAIQNGTYAFNGVPIKAGGLIRFNHAVTEDNKIGLFELPHEKVDIDTISVYVQPNITSAAAIKHYVVDNIFGVTSADPVFWVQEGIYGQYNIYFGDGVLGRGLQPGDVIQMEYLIADETANGIRAFSVESTVAGFTSSRAIVSVSSISAGGTSKESIESIKRNAPLFRSAQNRAVTSNDYISLLRNKFPLIDSVAVWGGEDNVPPIYGKVFVSIKPRNGFIVSNATKNLIIDDYLKRFNVASITPEYVDPDYLYISVAAAIKYNPSLTTSSPGILLAYLRPSLQQYFTNQLNDFNKVLRSVDIANTVKNIDNSFQSVNVDIRIQKRFQVVPYKAFRILTEYSNPLQCSSIVSQIFTVALGTTESRVIIRDLPRAAGTAGYQQPGDLWLYKLDEQNVETRLTTIGTIQYNTGVIDIPSISIGEIANNTLILSGLLRLPNDVVPKFNQLVVLDDVSTGTFVNLPTGVSATLEVV